MTGTVTLGDVRDAARRLDGAVVRTPSAVSATLGEVLGCTVVVKFENLQFTASFKERGARNMLERLTPDQRAAGVVAVSAGNHAQAVARHARLLGIEATIVMPEPTPFVKVSRTRVLGAEVELCGETLGEAMARGEQLVAEQGRVFVHPFDDPDVIAGGGTVALELLADHPDLDVLLVPVGGGGLLAGMSVVARELHPDVEIVGVQTAAYPSMLRALAGDPAPVGGGPTLAEGIAVGTAGRLAARLLADAGARVVTVGERAIEEGINLLLEIEKVVAEGAAAAGVAALIDHPGRFRGRTVGIVLTGGNVDPRTLASVIMRGLVRTGRLNRWRVLVDDRPGALARLTTVVGAAGGNIIEVLHQRLLASVPVRFTEVELAVETMDADHGVRVLPALRDGGYRVDVVPLDVAP
ncbi:MAG TPA: threonine ammonia-lyase [Miltoncostaea sp.]|nr:threonine ammonia-lyase [Miltoncostaea sp.]